MKKLFFILLLINSIYFLWHLTMGSSLSLDRSGDRYDPVTQGDEAIILVKEMGESSELGRLSVAQSKQTLGESKTFDRKTSPTKKGRDSASIVAGRSDLSGTNRLPPSDRSEKKQIRPQINRSDRPGNKSEVGLEGSTTGMRGGGIESTLSKSSKKIDHRLASASLFAGGQASSPCYKLGPFTAKEPVEQATVDLAGIASWFHIVSDPVDVQMGFWVLYPPGPDFQASRTNFQNIKSQGIEEIWLFTNGELRGFISLGLFVSESKATKELARFKQLGIDGAEVRPWTVKENNHWLFFATGEVRGTVTKRVEKFVASAGQIELSTVDSCQQLVGSLAPE